MRRILTICLCLYLLILSMAVPSFAVEKLRIVVGGDHENPPFEFLDNGSPSGFNVELMRKVAETLGMDVEFRLGPWVEVRKGLEQGKIDALTGMYYSEERSKLVDFSVPHTMVSPGLFVRKDSPIRSLEDIKGKEIIVQKGDAIQDYLRENGITSHIVAVRDPADELRLLSSGRYDCSLMPSRFQGEYLIHKLGLINIKVIPTNLPQLQYCFAVHKGNSPLRYRLDEGLDILKVNGTYKKIYEKWFGIYEERNIWQTLRYIIWALVVIAGLLTASIIWSWTLRREVRKRTAELRDREESLRFTQFAVDNTIDQAFWMTEDSRFFYVNDAACNALGYTREELLQMSVPDIAPTFPPEVFAEHWRNLQENGHITFESFHRAKDGRVYPVEIRVNYVVFDGKEYNCAFATDITERKRVEEELRRAHDELEKRVVERTAELAKTVEALRLSQFCIDKAGIGIYQTDENGTIFSVNEYACQSLGYSREELLALSVFDIDPEITREWLLELKEMLDETGSETHYTTHKRKDGTTFPVEITANHLYFQGKRYGISFVKDITERKKAEEKLILQQNQLKELNSTLEERVREEVAKNREKDIMLIQQNRQAALGEILDHVAHQWKQPLYSISLLTYLLRDDDSLDAEEIIKNTDKILAQVNSLTQTLDDFRDFYRPDKEKSLFLIEESIDRALSFIMPALQFESIEVEKDVSPGLSTFGYPKEFTQVILNLLGNARDVFKERTMKKPRLIIKGSKEERAAVVTISDNAGGIAESIIDDIFSLNFTTKELSGGTGIGLYMSKNIIEKDMGGTLTVANLSDGAQFTIRLATDELGGNPEA